MSSWNPIGSPEFEGFITFEGLMIKLNFKPFKRDFAIINLMLRENNIAKNAKLSAWIPSDTHIVPVRNKVRRTHGWLCPYRDYRSNKHFTTQRHINAIHGSGEPVDSRTGETKTQKKSKASNAQSSMQSGYVMPAPNMVIAGQLKELSENKTVNAQPHVPIIVTESLPNTQNAHLSTSDEYSYSMPFLDAQKNKLIELGDDSPTQLGKLVPSPIQKVRFDKPVNPWLVDMRFSGSPSNMHLNNVPLEQRTDNYQSNSAVDFVDQLAPYDPAMAFYKQRREFLNLLKD
jgi:hypothetical protein